MKTPFIIRYVGLNFEMLSQHHIIDVMKYHGIHQHQYIVMAINVDINIYM